MSSHPKKNKIQVEPTSMTDEQIAKYLEIVGRPLVNHETGEINPNVKLPSIDGDFFLGTIDENSEAYQEQKRMEREVMDNRNLRSIYSKEQWLDLLMESGFPILPQEPSAKKKKTTWEKIKNIFK